MGSLLVIEPGALTTVQDLGRVGFASMGVPVGGAADARSLRAGNRILGNEDGAAGLEMTLVGATVLFEDDAEVAVTGSAAPAWLVDGGGTRRGCALWERVSVRTGERLRIGAMGGGARSCLCIRGGVRAERVLGSASTHVGGGFGGHQGRALRAGDRLEFAESGGHGRAGRRWRHGPPPLSHGPSHRELAAVDGAHWERFGGAGAAAFWGAVFTVSARSDRAGVRLEGPMVAPAEGGELVSEGMPPGAVQVAGGGGPIVLGVDGPTTGGYPVIACVATADMPELGRARPGDTLRFRRVTVDEARALLHERERVFDESFDADRGEARHGPAVDRPQL